MKLLYRIILDLYFLIIVFSSLFNKKARTWLVGRVNIFGQISRKIRPDEKIIWFHCASLGEFEQGRPVIERIRELRKDWKVLITFFSPSGYEIRKDYPQADYVFYLPLDFKRNARKFINLVNPAVAVFIKYEFWYNYISELDRRGIPVYGISTVFRDGQLFFRWYGKPYKKILFHFTHFFVQDEHSRELLEGIGYHNVTVAGDTRFDRVSCIASRAADIPVANNFAGEQWVVVAGSTWKEDEDLLIPLINTAPGLRWIIAPHEIHEGHLERLEKSIKRPAIRFSAATRQPVNNQEVLIIDNVGMLSSLYRYGKIAYIGGGFGRGIHNILEAAVYGIPVLFGPNYKKFREALDLISLGGAFPVHNSVEIFSVIKRFIDDNQILVTSGNVCMNYVNNSVGATAKIVEKLMKD